MGNLTQGAVGRVVLWHCDGGRVECGQDYDYGLQVSTTSDYYSNASQCCDVEFATRTHNSAINLTSQTLLSTIPLRNNKDETVNNSNRKLYASIFKNN